MRSPLRLLRETLRAFRPSEPNRNARESVRRRFSFESLEQRQMLAGKKLYYVSGSPSTNYTVRLTKTFGDSAFNNEVVAFVVDDHTGKVNGVAPAYQNYFNAVKNLPAGVERWSAFRNSDPNLTTLNISVPGGTYLAFATVQNAFSQATAATTWFTLHTANSDHSAINETGDHYSSSVLGNGVIEYGVEDVAAGDGADNDGS